MNLTVTTSIDGVIATNTTISRENLKSHALITEEAGGLSGAPLKDRSTEVIRFLAEKSYKAFPIIGVGGIHSADDAIEKLDAGAIVLQKEINIKEKNTSQEIHDQLAQLGGKLINDVLKILQKEEKIKSIPQDETNTTYAKKISTEEAKINWNKSGKEILRQVKAFNPIPGAWFTVNKERIKIFDADISSSSTKSAGLILDKNFSISCGNGDVLNPKILQRSGKSQMDINTFIRGFHFEVNQKIE